MSLDNSVKVWSAKTGAVTASIEHGSYIYSAAWSLDGERIATSTSKDGLRIMSADGEGEPLALSTSVPVIATAFLDGGKRLLTVASDNTTRAFTIEIDALKRGLERANADCLPTEKRVTYLGESADSARGRYEACERLHGRTASLMEAARPGESRLGGGGARSKEENKAASPAQSAALGPAEHLASVFVIPGDAIVELDGRQLVRTSGVIELPGKVGAELHLRVFKGTRSTGEKLVIIKEAGASPSLIDLNEASAAGAGGPGAKLKPARFNFGD